MSIKPDRFLLMVACDKLEEDGFDPEQVAILRSWVVERCQPKVKDVVEMAMRLRQTEHQGVCHAILRASQTDVVGGMLQIMKERLAGTDGEKLADKLLEMTPKRRQMVASSVAEKVRGLERPLAPTRNPAGTPTMMNPDGTHGSYIVASANMGGNSSDFLTTIPPFQIPDDDPRQSRWGVSRIESIVGAWCAINAPGLRFEVRPVVALPTIDIILSRGRFFAMQHLDMDLLRMAGLPEEIPGILGRMLRRLEQIEVGQNPATVL